MFQKKFLISFVLVFFISSGLIAHISISHKKQTSQIRHLSEKGEILPPYRRTKIPDLSDKRVRDEIERRIEEEKVYTPDYYYEPYDYNEKEELDNENILLEKNGNNNLRKLADSNVFDDVSIVDPLTTSYSTIKDWFISSMKQYSSNIILYPYQFDFEHEFNGTRFQKHYEQGGYISLDPKELDPHKIGLKTDHTLKIQKARALYDADIAILSILGYYKNENFTNEDYFTDGSEWVTYFQNILQKGITYLTYEEFIKSKEKNPQKTYTTFINETEIQKGNLMNDQLPRFGILIIPDFYLSARMDPILGKLKQEGIDKILEYYNNGGVIFATGKSGALLEEFGLVKEGTYNRELTLQAAGNGKFYSKGCESTYNKAYVRNDDDFDKQMVCITINKSKSYVLSSAFLTKSIDSSYKTLIDMDPENTNLQVINKGIARDLTPEEKQILPMVACKTNERGGKIFLMNYNPSRTGSDRNMLLNFIALSFSKELYITSRVHMNLNSTEMPDMPIPAGEAGFNLEVNTIIHNLNDQKIEDANLYVFIPDNFDWTQKPTGCQLRGDYTLIPSYILQKKSIEANNPYFYCNLNIIDIYEKKKFDITILVMNYKATQMKYSVLILESILEYKDSKKKTIKTMADYVKVNCEAAALLRVAINPDPSSFYPVKGEGQYVDNVVKVENKEQTDANEVEYFGLIPLISPLTDGNDQRVIVHGLKILPSYYKNADKNKSFEVPFRSDNAEDYIYSGELSGKNVTIVAEWDSPVLPVKETITPERVEKII